MQVGQIDAMTRRVEGLAHSEGPRPYHVLDDQAGSTGLAHELLAYADDQGRQAEARHRLFTAYFGEARPIFSVEDLVSRSWAKARCPVSGAARRAQRGGKPPDKAGQPGHHPPI